MSTNGDGLHSRFHHTDGSGSNHRAAQLVEIHDINGEDPKSGALSRPLLAQDDTDDFRRQYSASMIAVVRKEPTRWDSARMAAVSLACAVLDFLPTSVSLKISDELSPSDRIRIDDLRQALVKAFKRDDPVDVQLLQELWSVCHAPTSSSLVPSSSLQPPFPTDLKSEHWKQFGFQGTDPSTDFRGAGVLSLRNLLFVSHTYPGFFSRALRSEYPFAIAGINVSMILMTQLGLSAVGQTCLATMQNNSSSAYSFAQARAKFGKMVAAADDVRDRERVFSEVYCVGFSLLHEKWEKSKKNIMEFNMLLKQLAKQLETILKCANTLGDVLQHAQLD